MAVSFCYESLVIRFPLVENGEEGVSTEVVEDVLNAGNGLAVILSFAV